MIPIVLAVLLVLYAPPTDKACGVTEREGQMSAFFTCLTR